jgi:hypothetical protein
MNVHWTFMPPNGNAMDGVPWLASGAGRVAPARAGQGAT